jgi:hypothetical protein
VLHGQNTGRAGMWPRQQLGRGDGLGLLPAGRGGPADLAGLGLSLGENRKAR